MQNIFNTTIIKLKQWFRVLSQEEKNALTQDEEFPISRKKIVENLNTYDTIDQDKSWENLLNAIEETESLRKETKLFSFIKPALKYAAIFVGLSIGGYFLFMDSDTKFQPLVTTDFVSGIQLKTNDTISRELVFDDELIIENSNGETIGVQKGSELIYTQSSALSTNETHELSVPYGKKFQVTLSDGTKVYCDAGTVLKYPAQFKNDQPRKVTITGQAFFDVVKSKTQAFIVKTGAMDIQVLGTQFNVSSYPENDVTSTVLVEGSIAIQPTKVVSKEKIILVPGQRAAIQKQNGKLNIKDVNTYDSTSWMSDKLVFKKTPFDVILKTLSRQRNIIIINKNEYLSKQLFTAKFDTESIEQILKVFQLDTPFLYTKERNTITIN